MAETTENRLINLVDQQRLEFTQQTRKAIVDKLMANNSLPDDGASKDMLIRALDGMDTAVFKKAKLKVEDKANQNNEEIINISTQLLLNIKPGRPKDPSKPRSIELPDSIPRPELIPGQADRGTNLY